MDKQKGKIVAVNISQKKGVPKDTVNEVMLIVGFGVENDAHGGDWHRQVSLLGVESIDKMTKIGVKGLCSGKFAENLTTEGIELYSLPIGAKLCIGEAVIEITQIGKECHQKCAIFHQVGNCVMPTEGIFAKVLNGGKVKAGDEIIVQVN
jgi:MOSC domain-containing protein YiiM